MEMPSSANLPHRKPGRCRYCGCTDDRACEEGCRWYDREHTVCDSPRCVNKFFLTRLDKSAALLRLGQKIQGSKSLSCYSEAGVIVGDLTREFGKWLKAQPPH